MYVDIKRCPDIELATKLEEAAIFFGSQLLSRQLLPYLEIEIRLLKSLRDFGFCGCTDLVNAHNKPRSFEIALKSNVPYDTMMATLAHEMVHVKQFAKGQLSPCHERWFRTPVPDDMPYHNLPWEVEAACLEQVLIHNYKEWINSQNESQQTCHPST